MIGIIKLPAISFPPFDQYGKSFLARVTVLNCRVPLSRWLNLMTGSLYKKLAWSSFAVDVGLIFFGLSLMQVTTNGSAAYYFLGMWRADWASGFSPYCIPSAAICFTVWSVFFRRARMLKNVEPAKQDICSKCGYDIRACEKRCSECGNLILRPFSRRKKNSQG
jgi:hypothetical protein